MRAYAIATPLFAIPAVAAKLVAACHSLALLAPREAPHPDAEHLLWIAPRAILDGRPADSKQPATRPEPRYFFQR